MQKSRINKLSQMFAKLAADKDAKELKKINLGKLRAGNIPEGEEPRYYYQRLNQEAEQGPIFSANTIFSIQSIPETSLPKNRKPFVFWLADQFEQGLVANIRDIDNISDYVNAANISDFSNLTFQRLKHLSDGWHEGFITVEKDGDYQTKNVVYSFDNGYTIVSVPSEDLDVEGRLMGHCVGSYREDVESNGFNIFSLRDSNNKPHATISFKNNDLDEIKGKQNQIPIPKYSEMIKEWLRKNFESYQYIDSNDFLSILSYEEYLDKMSEAEDSDKIRIAIELGGIVKDQQIIKDIVERFGNSSLVLGEVLLNPNVSDEILQFGYQLATSDRTSSQKRNFLLRKLFSNPSIPEHMFEEGARLGSFDTYLAENKSTPDNIQKYLYFKYQDSDENIDQFSDWAEGIRSGIAENTKDIDMIRYIIQNEYVLLVLIIAFFNRNFSADDKLKLIDESPQNFIKSLSKIDDIKDIDYVPEEFFESLLKSKIPELVEISKKIIKAREEATLSKKSFFRVAQDLSSELEELMNKLTGDSMPDEPNQKPEQSPAQQFQEIIESNQQAIYQLPVRHGKKGVPLIDERGQETGEKPWIVGTFIPSVKINERHPQGHNGVDLASDRGTPIYPIGPGEVIEQRNYSKGGITVKVSHEDGKVISYYAHLDSANVSPGAKVGPNTQLGTMGDTGNAKGTNPHLHFEVSVDGKKIDPMSIMGQPVGSLSRKAEIIKEIGSILNKYAKDRGDLFKDLIKK